MTDVITVARALTARGKKKNIGKIFNVGEGGEFTKQAAANPSIMEAKTVVVPDAQAMRDLLDRYSQRKDVALIAGGIKGVEPGVTVRILPRQTLMGRLKKKANGSADLLKPSDVEGLHDLGDGPLVMARLKVNFYPSSWVYLDRDLDPSIPDKYTQLDTNQWLAECERILPGLGGTDLVECHSSTSRVLVDGAPLALGTGHVWFQVDSPEVVPKLRVTLRARAWNCGLSWVGVREHSGGHMARYTSTLVDLSVFTPERLIFTAQPTVHAEGGRKVELLPYVKGIRDGWAGGPLPIDTEADYEAARSQGQAAGYGFSYETADDDRVRCTRRDDLSLDQELETRNYGVCTLQEVVDGINDGSMSDDGEAKVRVQSPFRPSDSWAAWVRVLDNGQVMLRDVASEETHYLEGASAEEDFAEEEDLAEEEDPGEGPQEEDEGPVYEAGPRGLVGEMTRFAMDRSIRPEPDIALLTALVAMSALTANQYEVEGWDTRLNLSAVIVAPTGAGKEDCLRTITQILQSASSSTALREDMSSGAAVLSNLSGLKRPSMFYFEDEMWELLESINSKNGSPHRKELGKMLMSLYGKADSVYGGKGYADRKNNIGPIKYPYVAFMGATTPQRFLTALTQTQVADGFLNRLLVARVDNTPEPRERRKKCPDTGLVERLADLQAKVDFGDPENPTVVRMADGVRERSREYALEADRRKDADLSLGALWSRAAENTLKVAGLVAVGLNAEEPVIDLATYEWAAAYVSGLVLRTAGDLEAGMSISDHDANLKKVLGFIKNAKKYAKDAKFGGYCKNGAMPRGQLIRLSRLDAGTLDRILGSLLAGEYITKGKGKVASNGKSATLFRVAE